MRLQLGLTPGQAIERLGANDPSLTICDLGNNAVLQIRSAELIPQLSAALAQNSHCKELNLSNSNLDDSTCEALGKALGKNNTLTLLNLEGNRVSRAPSPHCRLSVLPKPCVHLCAHLSERGRGCASSACPLSGSLGESLPSSALIFLSLSSLPLVGSDGAIHLARGLASNSSIVQLNLMNQKGSRLGDAALHEFLAMFEKNVRQESRGSNARVPPISLSSCRRAKPPLDTPRDTPLDTPHPRRSHCSRLSGDLSRGRASVSPK